MDSDKVIRSLRVVLFPWLAHGHIFPYLEFAKRILHKKSFHIYLCSTSINFDSINNFIEANSLHESIELVQLHLQYSQLPPHYHTTKNLPSNLNLTLVKAFQTARSSFSDIITNLKPDLVIYDVFQPWAAQIASSQSIPAVHFAPFGAATYSYMHHHYTCWNRDFPFPDLRLHHIGKKTMDNLMEFLSQNVFEQDKHLCYVNFNLSSDLVLLKTCRALEGEYLNYVSSVCNKKVLPVGPLVARADKKDEMILQWLNKRKHSSVVYISFGSEYFLSKEEIEEIAKGLELCELVNFIWVIRFPFMEKKTISIEEVLPLGFLERVKDRGIVMSGWAPQGDILGHPSTGAFVSHCGWSSCNESMYHGVPMIGMPVKINMCIDAKMLVAAGACVEVAREENGVYRGESVAKAINEVVLENIGEGLRRRARELGEKMRMEEEEAMDQTAEYLWQLCCKNKNKD